MVLQIISGGVSLRIEPEVTGVEGLFANHKSFGKGAWKINKENMALISNLRLAISPAVNGKEQYYLFSGQIPVAASIQ